MSVKGGFNSVLRQAQKLQSRLSKVQEELKERTVEAQVAGGAVKITVNGSREVIDLSVAPEVVDSESVDELCDLLTVAFNEAMKNVSDMIETETNAVTGGVNMPWMF